MSTSIKIFETRLQNLRLLIKQWETATSLARELGHSNSSFLGQLAGPSPSRTISEKVARGIEQKLKLPERWMDEPHSDVNAKEASDDFLLNCVRVVSTCIRDARLTLDADQEARITTLAYECAKARGSIDKRFVQSLIELAKPKH